MWDRSHLYNNSFDVLGLLLVHSAQGETNREVEVCSRLPDCATQLDLMSKTRQELDSRKSGNWRIQMNACNSLTSSQYEVHEMTKNGNHVNICWILLGKIRENTSTELILGGFWPFEKHCALVHTSPIRWAGSNFQRAFSVCSLQSNWRALSWGLCFGYLTNFLTKSAKLTIHLLVFCLLYC